MIEGGVVVLTFLISATAGALAWTVKTLWRLDRRIVRIETKLGLQESEI